MQGLSEEFGRPGANFYFGPLLVVKKIFRTLKKGQKILFCKFGAPLKLGAWGKLPPPPLPPLKDPGDMADL